MNHAGLAIDVSVGEREHLRLPRAENRLRLNRIAPRFRGRRDQGIDLVVPDDARLRLIPAFCDLRASESCVGLFASCPRVTA